MLDATGPSNEKAPVTIAKTPCCSVAVTAIAATRARPSGARAMTAVSDTQNDSSMTVSPRRDASDKSPCPKPLPAIVSDTPPVVPPLTATAVEISGLL